jgi:ADP-ribose pyrophosphatase YjhB (NUDIX family)
VQGRPKKKKGKPAHYQLPGGKVDTHEVAQHGAVGAARIAAARELWEETGIDVRTALHRLLPVPVLGSEHLKGRRYFALALTDADAVSGGVPAAAGSAGAAATVAAQHTLRRPPFAVRLSAEHLAARFERECSVAVKAIELHSGGKNSTALASLGCCEAAEFWGSAAEVGAAAGRRQGGVGGAAAAAAAGNG